MHRVELKEARQQGPRVEAQETVPNVPCGVESLDGFRSHQGQRSS